jgi:protein-S-isoprenylcysteine O-methyltransferase Ste14
MIQVIIFCVVSAFLICLSRNCLFAPRSHGFYRFFAFEFILALILLNAVKWFSNPFSIQQVVSWLLLLISFVLAVHGFYLLRVAGHPRKDREDNELIGFEKTTSLVKSGAFKYIRHPLYASLFYGVYGAFFKNPSWPGVALASAATVFLLLTAKSEEKECIRFFGADYQAYMSQTKMFVPFLF